MTDNAAMKSKPYMLLFSVLVCGLYAVMPASAQIREERLWLPASHSQMRPLLLEAAQRALQHPECVEVLYGRLNEFRTESGETAFTILCMKNARSTFNQVFRLSDLQAQPVRVEPREENTSRAELERLRNLLQGAPDGSVDAAPASPEEQSSAPPSQIF
jgi:hypothetical protein